MAILDHRPMTQFFVPYNAKIADITETDTNKHTLDLATALDETRKIISVLLGADRQGASSGGLWIYPNEGATGFCIIFLWQQFGECVIADGTQRLQYALDAANDDFDLYCFGYVVEA